MIWMPYLAIGLALLTIIVALVTGQRLGEARKDLFQLEMKAEQLRRQAADLNADGQQLAGRSRSLQRLRLQRQEALADLYDELRALRADDAKEVRVAVGLRQRHLELEEMAA